LRPAQFPEKREKEKREEEKEKEKVEEEEEEEYSLFLGTNTIFLSEKSV